VKLGNNNRKRWRSFNGSGDAFEKKGYLAEGGERRQVCGGALREIGVADPR
jgi:hypothetical protein